MTSTVTDVSELFDLLESSRPATVSEIKTLIAENFNTTRESWLVGGLYDYYIQTESMRCVEILTGISKEPHDKYLIERISDGLRGPTRKQSLIFLGHLVRKQPSWLYKIVQYGLFKEVIRILKTETDVVILVTGLLIVITLLPAIPLYLSPYVNEIFEVFSRLATWTHANNQEVAEEQLLHLQVGLYSMFHRLYAMYPCNFLSYLRHNFSSAEKTLVFHHTIKPMLETVKMHPLLVTANKDTELASHRWKSKEYHDVIAECSKLSIDVLETGIAEENSTTRPRLPPHQSSSSTTEVPAAQVPTIVSASGAVAEVNEMANLLNYVEEIGTGPNTPLTTNLQPHILTPPNADETAMEATPENTPLQTPVKDRERLVFKLPDRASSAAVHLNFGAGGKILQSNPPTVPNPTPVNSVPSSPLPQTEPGRRESNAGEVVNLGRRDSMLLQRLQKVLLEQQQQQQQNESRGLQINIPQNEADSQEPPGGPLTPLLAPTPDVDEQPAPCAAESRCRGGLHMPDTKSLIAFANRVKRLRFYSQCEDTKSKGKVKRSYSCPDVTEEANEEAELIQAKSPARPAYEHLFEGILDVWGDDEDSSNGSPHVLLDDCVKKAASLHGGSHQMSEARLKAQIELLHNQLLFERHRREAHTLRNRRLANKARKAQTCEELNSTYRSQIHQLEKEIASLKKELIRQRSASTSRENELLNVIKDFECKLKNARSTIESLENKKMDLEEKLRLLREECMAIMKEADGKSARIFELENEVKYCQEFVTQNAELQAAYQSAQKSIIMLGELCRRQEEMLNLMEPTRNSEDVEDIKLAYEEEIRFYKAALEAKSSQYEACVGYIQDIEQSRSKKEKIIEELKKQIDDMGNEYHVKLRSLEDKHESLKAVNHRLELDILNLQHQVSIRQSGGSQVAAAGPSGTDGTTNVRNGVSPTDSDVTVDSAASAGGFGGMNSPERNEFIFGSPQFDNAAGNQTVMKDLRPNID